MLSHFRFIIGWFYDKWPPKAAEKFGPFGGPLGLGNGPGLWILEPCELGWGLKGLGGKVGFGNMGAWSAYVAVPATVPSCLRRAKTD